MRRAAKVDLNQGDIVGAWLKVGASVQLLSSVGEGCPDALVGFRGANFLCEIKNGGKVPSKRQLTPDQKDWHGQWRGNVKVVASVLEALEAIGA